MNLPAPLLPLHVDLKDFPFMPVDITRLFGSEFHANSDDCTWRAGMTLWLKSYHQMPSGSLPDDDVALARLAEFGRDVRTWRKVRDGALHGWTKCSDGRLYHKTVVEKALEAWIEKIAQRKVSAAGNAKRYKQEFDAAPYDADIELARRHLAAINPQSRMLARKGGKYATGNPIQAPAGTVEQREEPPAGSPAGTADDPEKTPKEIRKGREGKGSKSLEIEIYLSPEGRATDVALELFFEAFPVRSEEDGVRRELGRRLGEGVPLADIVAGARRYREQCAGRAPEHIGSPVRWLVSGRWRDGSVVAKREDGRVPGREYDGKWLLEIDSPQGRAWSAYHRDAKRSSPPWESVKSGLWYFPSEWPPRVPEAISNGAAA